MTDFPRSLIESNSALAMRSPALNIRSRRAGLTGLSVRSAAVAKPGGWKPGPDLGLRQLRPPNLGHCRNHHASLQAAADRLVLGGLSDGYPRKRHLGSATAAPTRFWLL
jgi:hypothetical protein